MFWNWCDAQFPVFGLRTFTLAYHELELCEAVINLLKIFPLRAIIIFISRTISFLVSFKAKVLVPCQILHFSLSLLFWRFAKWMYYKEIWNRQQTIEREFLHVFLSIFLVKMLKCSKTFLTTHPSIKSQSWELLAQLQNKIRGLRRKICRVSKSLISFAYLEASLIISDRCLKIATRSLWYFWTIIAEGWKINV